MRLIDLDQTTFVPIVDDSVGTSYELQMTVGELFDRAFEGNVPETVDAIPVEWIRAKMDEEKREADKGIGNAAFTLAVIAPMEYLINEWQKEQEAR